MLIKLFPTPFGHFQFLGSARQNPNLILTLCLSNTRTRLFLTAILEAGERGLIPARKDKENVVGKMFMQSHASCRSVKKATR